MILPSVFMSLKVKNIKYLLLLTAFAAVSAAFTSDRGKVKTGVIKTIVIDAGHGGKDPGCNGVHAKEKDVSLNVALKLGKLIEANMKDVKVIYTRTTDVFVDLEERAQIANRAKADLFISIHCNAAGKVLKYKDPKTGKMKVKMRKNGKGKMVPVETTNPLPFGSETYVMGLKNEEGKMKVAQRENSAIYLEDDYQTKYGGFDPDSEESYIIMSNYTSAYVIQSANLALKIQDEYKNKAGRVDKGVHRQSIWVLWRTAMPSILTEIGYLTNPLEEEFLASEKGQDYMSKAIYRGLRKYKDELEGVKREYNDELESQEPLENENIKAGNLPGQKPKDEDEETEGSEPKKDSVITGKPKSETIVNISKTEESEEINKIKTEENSQKSDTISAVKEIADKFKKNEGALEITFKVQFASSDTELNLKDLKFSVIKNGSFYMVGTVLKYVSGNFASAAEATEHQSELRQNGFKDCFVVAFKNGTRIDLNEAKQLSKQK
jgi:N-acetylmuramoyl-L-alanine amidase